MKVAFQAFFRCFVHPTWLHGMAISSRRNRHASVSRNTLVPRTAVGWFLAFLWHKF